MYKCQLLLLAFITENRSNLRHAVENQLVLAKRILAARELLEQQREDSTAERNPILAENRSNPCHAVENQLVLAKRILAARELAEQQREHSIAERNPTLEENIKH
jgi:hypothetical protein